MIWKCESMRKQVPATYRVLITVLRCISHKSNVLDSSFFPDLPKSNSIFLIFKYNLNSPHLENCNSLVIVLQLLLLYFCDLCSEPFLLHQITFLFKTLHWFLNYIGWLSNLQSSSLSSSLIFSYFLTEFQHTSL